MPRSPVMRPGLLLRLGRAVGVTSTRRAAILAMVVFALGLSVAVPLQNYLGQRADIAEARARQEVLTDQVAELQRRRELLSDPNHTEAQARERLRYVYPGDTPYVVQLPRSPTAAADPEQALEPREPWYTRLWHSITGDGG
ncbi:MAG: septum formation initiator family protein [Pseudonocardiaceae bacterium]|nr:septum formation initiator family protein [Pseudonocardiaceae bacterium]